MPALHKRNENPSTPSNRLLIVTIACVFLFLGGCGVLYWQYVSSQALYLKERNFRSLATTSQALTKLIANYEKVFTSIVEGSPRNPPAKQSKYTLFCSQGPLPPSDADQARAAALCALPGLKNVSLHKNPDHEISGFVVRFGGDRGASPIKLNYTHTEAGKPDWNIKAEIDIARVMRQLTSEEIFADLLLADNQGNVIYQHPSQRDPSGLELTSLAPMFEDMGKPDRNVDTKKDTNPAASSSRLVAQLPFFREVPLGEILYKVFAQAGLLPNQANSNKTSGEFILAGIVPAGKFDTEARAISTNILLLLIGIILAILFVLPYVKLRSMQPTERLTPTDIVVLMLFSFMGTGLLTFGVNDVLTYQNLQERFDEQLKQVTKEIQNNFNDDLDKAKKQLSQFDKFCADNDRCKKSLQYTTDSKEESPWLTKFSICQESAKDKWRVAFSTGTGSDCKPSTNLELVSHDVNNMLLISPDGQATVWWSREGTPWQKLPLHERKYVSRIWDGTALKTPQDPSSNTPQDPFWIEPIYSWATGENYTIISQASKVPLSSSGGKGGSTRPIVAALEVTMPSLMNPVVSVGFGFAVIDQDGLVLFHSDSRRNLRENFFEETDQNPKLRAAVFVQRPGVDGFDGKYWGKDRRFFVTPLSEVKRHDMYWSLVTYWDIDLLRSTNLHALSFSCSLFSIYSIFAFGIGVLGFIVYPSLKQGHSGWMWPQRPRRRQYLSIAVVNVFSLLLIGIWASRPESMLSMLIWALWLPLLALAAGHILLRSNEALDDGSKGLVPLDHRQSYVLMVATILLANAMAPAFGFLKIAFDAEMRPLVRYSQLDLSRNLERQEQQIRSFYRNFGTAEDSFIQHRLTLENRGLYADFPFGNVRIDPSIKKPPQENPPATPTAASSFRETEARLLTTLQALLRVHINHHLTLDTGGFIQNDPNPSDSETPIPRAIPQPLYWALAFTVPFFFIASVLLRKAPTSIKAVETLATVGIAATLVTVVYGFQYYPESTFYVAGLLAGLGLFCRLLLYLPRFAARRIFLLDFPFPLRQGHDNQDETMRRFRYLRSAVRSSASWTRELRRDFIAETCRSDELRNIGEGLLKNTTLVEAIRRTDDYEVAKEQIIREVLEAAGEYYNARWDSCSPSESLALFHLARDRFLHAKNPDIRPLLHDKLIVCDPDLRLMNESFRRFVVTTGVTQRLTEWNLEGSRNTWAQVGRPVGLGVALIALFLIVTQEQYQAITLGFLTALPGLLGAFSHLLNTSRKENMGGGSSG